MFILLFFAAGSSGPTPDVTYVTGILHPVIDTAGNYSTSSDPDGDSTVEDVSTALGPTD